MQLKHSYIVLLFLFIVSCQSNNKNSEEVAVLAAIYNAMPKVILPPPPLKNEIDSIYIKQKKLIHAIYNRFINLESRAYVSNMFYRYKSDILFDKVQIDSVSMGLARSLVGLDFNEHINKKKLDKYVNEDLIYLNERFPNKEKKRKHGINGVICFSRVAFDSEYKKAAVCVGLYYDKLSTSQTIYILEKVNNEWKIKFTEVGEIS